MSSLPVSPIYHAVGRRPPPFRTLVQPAVPFPRPPATTTCRVAQDADALVAGTSSSSVVEGVPAQPSNQSDAGVIDPDTLDKELIAKKTAAAAKVFSKSKRKVGSARLLVDSLKRTSLVICGDDGPLLREVAKVAGSRVGWFPADVPKIICGMRKVEQLEQLSAEDLVAAEAEVLRGLRRQAHVIAATLPRGATWQHGGEELWQELWGNVIIWVEEEDKSQPKKRDPEAARCMSKAEVVVRTKPLRGFGTKGGDTVEGRGKAAAELLLNLLNDLVVEDPGLVERKRQYRERGFRGDWPQVMPEGWSPVAQQLERKPLVGFEEDSGKQ